MKRLRSALFIPLPLVVLLWKIIPSLPGVWNPEVVDPIHPATSSSAAVAATAEVFSSLVLLLLLLLLLFLGSVSGQGQEEQASRVSSVQPVAWSLVGFIGTVALAAAVGFAINPWGMYPAELVPPRVENSRDLKTSLYGELDHFPEIMILGSSRLVSIPGTEIEKRIRVSAFNAAFFGGRPRDFLTFAELVYDHQVAEPPDVLIVELSALSPSSSEPDLVGAPPQWLPYLSPGEALHWWAIRLRSLLSLDYLADSFYTLRYQRVHGADTRRWEEWTFDETGSGSRPPSPYFTEVLQDRIDSGERITCQVKENALVFEELTELAVTHGTAVVFVSISYHPAYVEKVLEPSERYARCVEELEELAIRLQSTFPDVYYLDFGDLASFNGIATDRGFYDHQHVTAENGRRLIHAAEQVLSEALGQ